MKKWKYHASSTCSTNPADYNTYYGTPITINNQDNNGDWFCLYAEDALGNDAQLASSNDINIDITPPTAAPTCTPSGHWFVSVTNVIDCNP